MSSSRDWPIRVAVGWILAMFAAGAAGCGSGPVVAPTAYADYNAKKGTFACQYPEGWQAEGGGGRGPEWAKFTSGPAAIRISTGVTGSVIGEMGRSGRGDEPLPPELEPVHGFHQMQAEAAAKEYSSYKELGEPQVLEAALGPARRSEFTASTTFGSGMHGYRATILGQDRDVAVYCICPESDWTTLQPAFDHVLASIKRGHPE